MVVPRHSSDPNRPNGGRDASPPRFSVQRWAVIRERLVRVTVPPGGGHSPRSFAENMNPLRKFTLTLIGCLLLGSCSRDPAVVIVDGDQKLAKITFKSAHAFLGEYDREITLSSGGKSRTWLYPPDTGGDTPIAVSRHKDQKNDFLWFQGRIYTVVFDLTTLDYAKGSDRPEHEIYTGRYTGPPLPPVSGSWTISRDFQIIK